MTTNSILSEFLGGPAVESRFSAAARADRRSTRLGAFLGQRRHGPQREDLAHLHREFGRCGFVPDLFRNIEYTYALSRLRANRGRRWIDLGCGDSPFMALAMAESSADATTFVDFDPAALDAQRANVRALGIAGDRARFVAADLTAPRPLESEQERFGGAVVVSAIEHFPGDADMRTMERLWEMLEPGAPVVVTVPALHHYEENSASHYHGMFERRYDLRAFFARLQPNGYAVDDLLFINHARNRAAQVALEQWRDLNELFRRWYAHFSMRPGAADAALFLSQALLDVSPAPDASTVGIMATLRREDKRAIEPIASATRAAAVVALPEPAEPAQGIQLYSPHRHIVMKWNDHVVVPLVLVNLWDRTIPSLPQSPGVLHLGVHLKSVLRDDVLWDYAHVPLPLDLPAKSMAMGSITLPSPKDLCDFEYVIDVCKEGEYWQGETALAPVSVRVTLR